jgi:hypothetical protein
VTLSVGVCCSSPRADRVYYLGVGLFLALYFAHTWLTSSSSRLSQLRFAIKC